MSEKTGELILALAKQGGVELDETQTKAIQEIATELPEGISTQIQGSLFTKESALANPDIINKIKADSLDPVDSKMEEFAKAVGLDEGFIHNLKDTKGTYNRIDAVSKALLASHEVALKKAAEGAPAGDQEELNKKIAELNKQILTHGDSTVSKTDHDDTVEGYEDLLKEKDAVMLALKSNSLFAQQNWAMDVDASINVSTAQTLFNAELASKNIKLVEDNGILKLQTGEGTPYYVENKEVSPQDFANALLAGKKLLKVTDPNPTPTPTPIPGGGGDIDPSVAAAIAAATESAQNVHNLKGTTA